jgi:hypothetical protein
MVGAKSATGVNVTYTFDYGCTNKFEIAIARGAAEALGNVTKTGACSFRTAWAAPLRPPPPPPPSYRCAGDACVAAPPGAAPGLTNASCSENCGLPSRCETTWNYSTHQVLH